MVSLTRPLAISSAMTTRPVSRVWISEPSIGVAARQVSTFAATKPSAQNSAAIKTRCVFSQGRETAAHRAISATAASGL
ncbi:hypothetical protein [Mesorhizobium sp.]|uniref:hypothetical protein n=1 Tax=Mesorhizobium sp. TaxID=1871066 RepID=UPI0025C3383F|nr:hypothetical protein [Mesorhizobium sp.]